VNEAVKIPDFNSSIVEHARKDFPLLDASMSVADELDRSLRETEKFRSHCYDEREIQLGRKKWSIGMSIPHHNLINALWHPAIIG
jgi:hypothetical protein